MIGVMLRGRHRGLPVAIDRYVVLKLLLMKDKLTVVRSYYLRRWQGSIRRKRPRVLKYQSRSKRGKLCN